MEKLKVRKIGNSLGVIFPRSSGLKLNDELLYTHEGTKHILDSSEADKAHDRALIEKSFEDFEKGLIVSHEEMLKEFGDSGWGK
jgi:hypothetical protein